MINIKIDFKIQIDESKFDRWCYKRSIGRNFARNLIKDDVEILAKLYLKENKLK